MVGVVLLVDANRDAVGLVCDLRNGVDNKTVVLLAVVGGYNIETVADLEQGCEVVLVSLFSVLLNVVVAESVGELFNLVAAVVVESRHNADCGLDKLDILAALEHFLHDLRSKRSPRAVLHKGDLSVLEVALGEMLDKLAHKWEDLGIVGRGSQHDPAVAECVLNALSHILTRKIVDNYLRAAL